MTTCKPLRPAIRSAALLAFLSLCLAVPAAAQPYAFITNPISDDISVIDTVSDTVIATLDVEDPRGVVFSPDGSIVYVTGFEVDILTVIDGETFETLNVVPGGDAPVGIDIHPDGHTLYLANMIANGSVTVIDAATLQITATVPTGANSLGVAAQPNGERVWITSRAGGGLVSILDTATNQIVAEITDIERPEGIAFNPAGDLAFITNVDVGEVVVVDPETLQIVAEIPSGGHTQHVAIHPNGQLGYSTNRSEETVTVFDAVNFVPLGLVGVGSGPLGVGVHPDGTRVYVADDGDHTTTIFDTATLQVLDVLDVGLFPHAWGKFIGPGTDGGGDEESVGGSATDVRLNRVTCRNTTAGGNVVVQVQGQSSGWDCEEAGLNVSSGDSVVMVAASTAQCSGTCSIGGAATGVQLTAVTCRNQTTGSTLQAPSADGETWSCTDAGLAASDGDRISQILRGVVD